MEGGKKLGNGGREEARVRMREERDEERVGIHQQAAIRALQLLSTGQC